MTIPGWPASVTQQGITGSQSTIGKESRGFISKSIPALFMGNIDNAIRPGIPVMLDTTSISSNLEVKAWDGIADIFGFIESDQNINYTYNSPYLLNEYDSTNGYAISVKKDSNSFALPILRSLVIGSTIKVGDKADWVNGADETTTGVKVALTGISFGTIVGFSKDPSFAGDVALVQLDF